MFSFAVENELRADNPVAGIKKYRENARDVAFTDDELARIAGAIGEEREVWARTALTLLMVTGARVGEVLASEWSEFDFNENSPAWRIPAARMKGGKPHTYTLDPDTVALLSDWRRDAPFISTRWVFPNAKGSGPKDKLQKPWARIKEAAGVTRGVLHSFRHTFLTRMAEAGASAIDIRNTGGHADIATSMKYVHAAENARLRELQDANRKSIREAMKGKSAVATVVALPNRSQ